VKRSRCPGIPAPPCDEDPSPAEPGELTHTTPTRGIRSRRLNNCRAERCGLPTRMAIERARRPILGGTSCQPQRPFVSGKSAPLVVDHDSSGAGRDRIPARWQRVRRNRSPAADLIALVRNGPSPEYSALRNTKHAGMNHGHRNRRAKKRTRRSDSRRPLSYAPGDTAPVPQGTIAGAWWINARKRAIIRAAVSGSYQSSAIQDADDIRGDPCRDRMFQACVIPLLG
jgi:hypothetical protein